MNNLVKDNERDSISKISDRIVERRKELDLHPSTLAEMVGTTQTSIRRLEGGETNVSAILLIRTANVLGMPLEDLLAPIKSESELVADTYLEHKAEVERSTSAMGLTEQDVEDFYTQRDLLRLMKLWPR
jgi:transcriptional regulator with XRE-family HTH domain